MLTIRFFRVGKKNQPSFKIVVTDKRNAPRAGRFVEEVGFWNPITKEKILKPERIKYWLSVGAKPSASIFNLLIKEKITEGKKIPKHNVPKKSKTEKTEKVKETEKTEEKKETEAVKPAEAEKTDKSGKAEQTEKSEEVETTNPVEEEKMEEIDVAGKKEKPEETKTEKAEPVENAEKKRK